jgi:deoxyadenosine/deoxycytidine kinase
MAGLYQQTQKCFIVDGNIGAGKSTFLSLIKKYINVQVVFEPHTRWQKVVGQENLLEKFYNDPSRWSYTFQSYAFVTRVQEQVEAAKRSEYPIQVLERSVFSDRYCFAKNCYELGYMNALEWKLYQEWFTWLVGNYVKKPDGFIYLQTDPSVCHQRLLKRSRKEELEVSRDYLQQLHDKHESWLVKKEGVADFLQDTPVLVLDCNIDFENNPAELERHVQKIVDFFMLHGGQETYKSDISSLSL